MTSHRQHGDPGTAADRLDRTAMDLIPAAVRTFGQRVHAVRPDDWARPTPCDRWTVHDLVGHLTSEHLWAPELLAGRTIEDVGTRFDGDVLGSAPVAAWDHAAEASVRAWRDCSPGTTVRLSSGEPPAADYAEQMLLDLLVHAWDLGSALRRAGGADRLGGDARADDPGLTAMDRAQVVHVLGWVRRHHQMVVGSGLFGSPEPDDGGEGPTTLLRLLGRDPYRRPAEGATGTTRS